MTAKANSLGVNSKGRNVRTKSFAGIPRVVMETEDFSRLSSSAKCLLLELAYQYRGFNNGDLTAAFSILKTRGWRSPTTLNKALKQLLEMNFIVCTRHGRFQNPGAVCSLYAITWLPIDECRGKHDAQPSSRPIRRF